MAIRVISSSRRKSERQSRRPQTSVAQRVRRKKTRRFRPAARRERRCVPGAATRYAIGPGARNAACVTFATGCYAQRREFPAVRFACARRFLVGHRTSSLACLSACLTDEARNTDRHASLRLLSMLNAGSGTPPSALRPAFPLGPKECSVGGTNRDFAIRCTSCCHKIGFVAERCRLRYRRGRSALPSLKGFT